MRSVYLRVCVRAGTLKRRAGWEQGSAVKTRPAVKEAEAGDIRKGIPGVCALQEWPGPPQELNSGSLPVLPVFLICTEILFLLGSRGA